MSNPSKQKGTAFETQCVTFLKKWFPRIYRPALQGGSDTGDINGLTQEWEVWDEQGAVLSTHLRHAIIQCKNQKTMKLSEWLNDTKAQALAKGAGTLGILLVKRRGIGPKNMGKTYAVLELDDLVSLMKDAGYD